MTVGDFTVLDLALDPRYAALGPVPPRPRRATLVIVLIAFAALLCAAVAAPHIMALGRFGLSQGQPSVRISFDQQHQIAAMTVEDKSQILAEGLDAQQRNAEIPVSGLPLEHVSALKWTSVGGSSYATALRCLTQAVYYEAASEPLQGRRAVAQVVLNRVRHPAYPNSVCGVVYQGIERGWGCQFSFVCDGALLRTPSSVLWGQAQGVAQAALTGYVETNVGTATHYHADYVLPKWAFQLAKIQQIGRHIFYRFNGNWGRTTAFNERYSGVEHIPMINLAALQRKLGEPEVVADLAKQEGGLSVPPAITDRHALADVGGRLDVTKAWRLAIPDPVAASSRYRLSLKDHTREMAGAPELAAAGPVNQLVTQ
jgi:hypothetical protein